ncbi:hypothetical protein ACFV2U_16035 [Streptomyces sp. NPDC059697]|uniref:hypothetical protein n=1 Tax=Streptomyces sp. NPDC059697 TaxID=3346912 RepID=UPI00368465E3
MNHILCGLAANPALPAELVDRLIAVAIADPDADAGAGAEIAAELAARPDLGHAQARALAAHAEDIAVHLAYEGRLTSADIDPVAQPQAALALLDTGAGPPEWARRFATDPVTERREKLAACPDLPPDVTDTLAADSEVAVVAELALWTTPDMAARLARHPHAEVRRAVAANEATPPAVLEMLLTGDGLPPARRCLVCDRERTPAAHARPRPADDLPPGAFCTGSHESTLHEMWRQALSNPATPARAAAGFADHTSGLLRWALAARPDLPPEAGRRLADDPLPGVRADLAENPALDAAHLRALATDVSPDVRRSVAHNPQVPLDVLTALAGTAKIGATLLPRIAAATPAEVEELAESRDPVVRMLLAARRDLPPGIRDALAADTDAKVLKSIAPHPGLSEARLRAMIDRHGVRVLARVATNPDASPSLLEHVTRHDPPVQKAFREVARHPGATAPSLLACLTDRQARPAAAAHPSLPAEVIVELLSDDEGRVAEAAAANPSLPRAVMAKLTP